MAKQKKSEPSQLTDHIGYWMRMVSNNVSHSFARKLENSGVTVAEWVVLREMYAKSSSTAPSDIAAITGLTRGAISKLISRLLEKGFVTREESSGDRRYQEIELTTKGRTLVPRLVKLADQNDDDYFCCLSNADRTHLKALLQKIASHHQIKTVPIE